MTTITEIKITLAHSDMCPDDTTARWWHEEAMNELADRVQGRLEREYPEAVVCVDTLYRISGAAMSEQYRTKVAIDDDDVQADGKHVDAVDHYASEEIEEVMAERQNLRVDWVTIPETVDVHGGDRDIRLEAGTYLVEMPDDYDPSAVTVEDLVWDDAVRIAVPADGVTAPDTEEV